MQMQMHPDIRDSLDSNVTCHVSPIGDSGVANSQVQYIRISILHFDHLVTGKVSSN